MDNLAIPDSASPIKEPEYNIKQLIPTTEWAARYVIGEESFVNPLVCLGLVEQNQKTFIVGFETIDGQIRRVDFNPDFIEYIHISQINFEEHDPDCPLYPEGGN